MQPGNHADVGAHPAGGAQHRNHLLVPVTREAHDDAPDVMAGHNFTQVGELAQDRQGQFSGRWAAVQEAARAQAQLRVFMQQPGDVPAKISGADHQGRVGQQSAAVRGTQSRAERDTADHQQSGGPGHQPQRVGGRRPGQDEERRQRGGGDDAPGLIEDPQADPHPVQPADCEHDEHGAGVERGAPAVVPGDRGRSQQRQQVGQWQHRDRSDPARPPTGPSRVLPGGQRQRWRHPIQGGGASSGRSHLRRAGREKAHARSPAPTATSVRRLAAPVSRRPTVPAAWSAP